MNWAKCPILTFAVLFFKELLENIDAKTETGESPSKKLTKLGPNLSRVRKRSSITILDDEGIEEFQKKQDAKNTVKGIESAVRRVQPWYNNRYSQTLELTCINKTNPFVLLKHFFLQIRDTRKDRIGEENEPSTLGTYRNGVKEIFSSKEKTANLSTSERTKMLRRSSLQKERN